MWQYAVIMAVQPAVPNYILAVPISISKNMAVIF